MRLMPGVDASRIRWRVEADELSDALGADPDKALELVSRCHSETEAATVKCILEARGYSDAERLLALIYYEKKMGVVLAYLKLADGLETAATALAETGRLGIADVVVVYAGPRHAGSGRSGGGRDAPPPVFR